MSVFFIIPGLIILISASAFFSASETAFLSISKITLRRLVAEKKSRAELISRLKSNASKLLTTILIGNNLVNNLASSLGAALAIAVFGDAGVGIATIVMTLLIIIFGETVPKALAASRPVPVAQKTAPFLRAMQIALHPLVLVFSGISAAIGKLVHLMWSTQTPAITEEELKTLIELGSQEGTLEKREKEMLNRVFEFSDLRVRTIMKDRSLLKALSDTSTYAQAIEAFASSGFSRMPVYSDDLDSICGIVHYKDLLFEHAHAYSENFSLRDIMRPALFVPDSKTAVSLLQLFRSEKQNLAVVIDEHGSTAGLVSMDDLLKAVFGRINDEYDTGEIPPEERVEIINQNEYRVPGNIALTELNGMFNLRLHSNYYRTLGGWLLEQFDALPSNGEHIRKDNVIFIIEEQSRRRIRSVKMKV